MKISANSIKAGYIIVLDDELWVVIKRPEHTQPGKGGAYVQVEMKNLRTGIKTNVRFSSSDHIERAELEQQLLQYCYNEGDHLVFMNVKNFEQIIVEKHLFTDSLPFLTNDMIVTGEFYQDKPISIKLPHTITAEILHTEAVIKGSTVTSSYKPATLTNGVKVMVPSYMIDGEKIVIKTEDWSFVERAKSQ